MSITRVIKQKSDRRILAEFYKDEMLLGHVDIHPFILYKDARLNFRDENVPDAVDVIFNGNVCSADLIGLENETHSAFFDTIYEYMKLNHFKMFLLNIREPLLYDFYLSNFAPYKEKMLVDYPSASWSWLEHDETKALIDSWNVNFEFQQPETKKMMIVYRLSALKYYQDSSWIKRRTELLNGTYL